MINKFIKIGVVVELLGVFIDMFWKWELFGELILDWKS